MLTVVIAFVCLCDDAVFAESLRRTWLSNDCRRRRLLMRYKTRCATEIVDHLMSPILNWSHHAHLRWRATPVRHLIADKFFPARSSVEAPRTGNRLWLQLLPRHNRIFIVLLCGCHVRLLQRLIIRFYKKPVNRLICQLQNIYDHIIEFKIGNSLSKMINPDL